MTATHDVTKAALEYRERGLIPLPTDPGSKAPLLKAWSARTLGDTTEPAIRAWPARWPDHGVGILTGTAADLFVLDVDRHDADGFATLAALEALHGVLPATWCAETGRRGLHYYFRMPHPPLRNSAGLLGPGLDTRGDGGQVIAPPSIHPNGRRYAWLAGRSPADLERAPAPTWLVKLLRPRPRPVFDGPKPAPIATTDRYAARALDGEIRRVLDATEGTRNDTLNRAAFSLGPLVCAGLLDEDTAAAHLARAAHRIGLAEREIVATIVSGLSSGRGKPRTASES